MTELNNILVVAMILVVNYISQVAFYGPFNPSYIKPLETCQEGYCKRFQGCCACGYSLMYDRNEGDMSANLMYAAIKQYPAWTVSMNDSCLLFSEQI